MNRSQNWSNGKFTYLESPLSPADFQSPSRDLTTCRVGPSVRPSVHPSEIFLKCISIRGSVRPSIHPSFLIGSPPLRFTMIKILAKVCCHEGPIESDGNKRGWRPCQELVSSLVSVCVNLSILLVRQVSERFDLAMPILMAIIPRSHSITRALWRSSGTYLHKQTEMCAVGDIVIR